MVRLLQMLDFVRPRDNLEVFVHIYIKSVRRGSVHIVIKMRGLCLKGAMPIGVLFGRGFVQMGLCPVTGIYSGYNYLPL